MLIEYTANTIPDVCISENKKLGGTCVRIRLIWGMNYAELDMTPEMARRLAARIGDIANLIDSEEEGCSNAN